MSFDIPPKEEGSGGGISDAPAGQLSVRTSGLWVNSTAISGQPIYDFSSNTDATDPGAGVIKFNNVDPSLVDKIYIDSLTASGTNIDFLIRRGVDGDVGVAANYLNPAQFIIFKLIGCPIDNGGWFTLEVEVSSGGLPIDDGSDVSFFPFQTGVRYPKQSIVASNEISKDSQSYTLGGDALQGSIDIPFDGNYEVGVVYQWRHERRNVTHRTRVLIDGLAIDDLDSIQYMGGANSNGTERVQTSTFTEMPLTAGTHNFQFQYSSGQNGRDAYLYYRRLYIKRVET